MDHTVAVVVVFVSVAADFVEACSTGVIRSTAVEGVYTLNSSLGLQVSNNIEVVFSVAAAVAAVVVSAVVVFVAVGIFIEGHIITHNAHALKAAVAVLEPAEAVWVFEGSVAGSLKS